MIDMIKLMKKKSSGELIEGGAYLLHSYKESMNMKVANDQQAQEVVFYYYLQSRWQLETHKKKHKKHTESIWWQ